MWWGSCDGRADDTRAQASQNLQQLGDNNIEQYTDHIGTYNGPYATDRKH